MLVLSICSCAKTWMEDKTADTSAVDNSDAVTSISVTPQSAEPGVYTELAGFLTDEQIQLYNNFHDRVYRSVIQILSPYHI